MTAKELERLTKLMQLTLSNQDGEALAALRKANSFLQGDLKMNWEDVFKRIVTGEIQDIGSYNWNQAQSYNAAMQANVQPFGNVEKWDPLGGKFTKK